MNAKIGHPDKASRRRRLAFASVALLVPWVAYFLGAVWLNSTSLRNVGNILFGSDQRRVSTDLVVFRTDDHYRTDAHPLFVITFNPIGASLKAVLHPLIRAAVETDVIERALRDRTGSEKSTEDVAGVLAVLGGRCGAVRDM